MSNQPSSSAGKALVGVFTLGLIGMLIFGITALAKTAKESYASQQAKIKQGQADQAETAQAQATLAQEELTRKTEAEKAAASPVAGANVEAGKAKYALCQTCHGANGEGMAPLKSPALAGLDSEYIIRQLKNFKDGLRGADPTKDMTGAQMAPMAKMLSDEDMANIAAYVQTLEGKAQHTMKGDAVAGKAKYALCATCHGPNAEGMPALKSPNLTNLPDYYIVGQLKNFKHGVRGADAAKDMQGSMMAPMAKMLSEQDMVNIAEYIKTLKK